MSGPESSNRVNQALSNCYPLIDTHTHFDAPVFAYHQGIRHLVLVGYLYQHFERMYDTKQLIDKLSKRFGIDTGEHNESDFCTHIALGLHPFYIEQHTDAHLTELAQMVAACRPLAIGEIGLDTFTDAMKEPDVFDKQKRFFKAQLDIAVTYQLPVKSRHL